MVEGITNRSLMMVSAWLYQTFWTEWVAIDKRWPHFETDPMVAKLRTSARNDLRQWLRENALGAGGRYPVPV
jgi:hypothetical protein